MWLHCSWVNEIGFDDVCFICCIFLLKNPGNLSMGSHINSIRPRTNSGKLLMLNLKAAQTIAPFHFRLAETDTRTYSIRNSSVTFQVVNNSIIIWNYHFMARIWKRGIYICICLYVLPSFRDFIVMISSLIRTHSKIATKELKQIIRYFSEVLSSE